jgi:hypothetical protein
VRAIIALACTLTVAGVGVARAEDPEAKRLFEEGRALAEQGKFAEACELYARSYELERAPGTMLNLGDCAEREGKFRRAWLMYDAAAAEYEREKKPARVIKFARDRADALAPRLATVVMRLAKPRTEGLIVRIGDRAAPPAAEIVERLDAGEVSILVSAPGHEPFSTTVTATGGQQIVVLVPALQRRPGTEPPPDERDATRRKRSRVLLAAGVAGAGVIALGAGGILAWSAKGLYDEQFEPAGGLPPACTQPASGPAECSEAGLAAVDRARLRSSIATVAGIGGGALVVAGAVLFVTAPRERVTVAPIASAGALGLAIGGRF